MGCSAKTPLKCKISFPIYKTIVHWEVIARLTSEDRCLIPMNFLREISWAPYFNATLKTHPTSGDPLMLDNPLESEKAFSNCVPVQVIPFSKHGPS